MADELLTLAQEYARLIKESRARQVLLDQANISRVLRLLEETAAGLRRELLTTPRGLLGARYKRHMAAAIERYCDDLRDRYKPILDGGIRDAAAIAATREAGLLQSLVRARAAIYPAHRLHAVHDAGRIDVEFGRVRDVVLDRLYARTYQDGLRLSQRLYNLDQDARKTIADELFKGIAKGASARKLAATLEPILTRPGVDNVRYKAMRIARTEINVAFREGHIASVTGEGGKLKPWVSAVGWRLSPAHPRTDICDAWAGDDSAGLGAGNYDASDVPPGHPHCLCYTVTILAALPDEQFVSRAPLPDQVPESQRRYYGVSK